MGVITRAFTSSDTTSIWTLLNELKGWIEQLRDKGGAARYWCGWPTVRDLGDAVNYSLKFQNASASVGGVAPVWSADAFSLPAGRYRIDVQVTFGDNPSGYRTLFLFKNPATTQFGSSAAPSGTNLRNAQVAATGNNASVQLTALVTMTAEDRLIVVVRQNSGATLGYIGAQQDSELMIERIGD